VPLKSQFAKVAKVLNKARLEFNSSYLNYSLQLFRLFEKTNL
jgi:hypothetical protein